MDLRILGVDYGTKRVGVAISDPLRLFATPVGTYSPTEALAIIKQKHEEIGLERIVIGWPLTLDGKEESATQSVQEYVRRIAKALPDVPISKIDERYSSKRAVHALVEAGVKKKARRQKTRIDSAAAAIILQDFLDGETS